jgi:hypothetical protein
VDAIARSIGDLIDSCSGARSVIHVYTFTRATTSDAKIGSTDSAWRSQDSGAPWSSYGPLARVSHESGGLRRSTVPRSGRTTAIHENADSRGRPSGQGIQRVTVNVGSVHLGGHGGSSGYKPRQRRMFSSRVNAMASRFLACSAVNVSRSYALPPARRCDTADGQEAARVRRVADPIRGEADGGCVRETGDHGRGGVEPDARSAGAASQADRQPAPPRW